MQILESFDVGDDRSVFLLESPNQIDKVVFGIYDVIVDNQIFDTVTIDGYRPFAGDESGKKISVVTTKKLLLKEQLARGSICYLRESKRGRD